MIWDSTNKHPTTKSGPQTRNLGATHPSPGRHAEVGKPRVAFSPTKPLRIPVVTHPAQLLPGARQPSSAATSGTAKASQYARPTERSHRAAPDDGRAPRDHYLKRDREMLRALRAAEMAVWNAAGPAQSHMVAATTRMPRLPAPDRRDARVEAWVLAIVAAGAVAAAWFGIADISKLLTGWTHFVDGIRNLIL